MRTIRHPPLSDEDVQHLFCDQLAGREPSAAEAVLFADEVKRLLMSLPDDPDRPLRTVARLLLECKSPKDIAAAQGCLAADVERYQELIHARWKREA